MKKSKTTWRVGTKVPINVYDGDRPVCQCHTAKDARQIVNAVNEAKLAATALNMLMGIVDSATDGRECPEWLAERIKGWGESA